MPINDDKPIDALARGLIADMRDITRSLTDWQVLEPEPAPPPIGCTLGFNASLDYAGFGLQPMVFSGSKVGTMPAGDPNWSAGLAGIIGADAPAPNPWDLSNKYAWETACSNVVDRCIYSMTILAGDFSQSVEFRVRYISSSQWALFDDHGGTYVFFSTPTAVTFGFYVTAAGLVGYAIADGALYETAEVPLSAVAPYTNAVLLAKVFTVIDPPAADVTMTLHTDKSEYARTFPSGQIDMCGNPI